MIIFPAIDIKDGVCVRLKKGDYRQITTYENTPIDQATTYFKSGFNNIHIVDIDGALHGRPVNSILIKEIIIKIKLPHTGWNEIELKKDCFLFSNIKNKSHMYFIHSYEFMTKQKDCIVATANYGNSIIVSVAKENIVGTQFHPEKSQKNGLVILENFLKWEL